MTLCCRSLRFPITALDIIICVEFSKPSLPFGRTFSVERPWLAICAVVNVWDLLTMVIAFDMLPCFTSLTENCIPIVILEVADALDGVIFLWRKRVRESAVEGRMGENLSGDRSLL